MEFGLYHAQRALAESLLGVLYEGEHRQSRARVLIHRLQSQVLTDAHFLTRLQDRVRLINQSGIAGVPSISDVGRLADGSVFLVMPLVAGEPLSAQLGRKAERSLSQGVHVGRRLARSLALAESLGLRHLALTPEQVLLTQESSPPAEGVWLLGLGLADLLLSAPSTEERADVLALGQLLSALLTPLGATLPLELTSLLQEMTARASAARPAMSAVSARLDAMSVADAAPVQTQVLPALKPAAEAPAAITKEASRSAAADPRIGVMFGNFRIVRKIGEGGMGVVYEAEHQKIGRRAAVKLLHPRLAQDDQYAQRFLNEARAVNIVRHRGLVEIFEFGKLPDGTLFYVMEFLEGKSLYRRITEHNAPFREAEAVALAIQIARALSAAHEKGIIHRDLKPENIMLEPDPVNPGLDWVKILDFGIAKVRRHSSLKSDPDRTDLDTRVGAFMGTPLYMAPEQHGQAEQVQGSADVFSLGVMLYELLAGQLPFQSNALSLLSNSPTPIHKLNSAVSKRLAALIDRMMSTRPAERPTMPEVVRQLEAFLPSSRMGKRQLVGIAATAALLAAALVFVVLRVERTQTPAEMRNRARAVLAAYLQDPDTGVRVLAVRALGQSRDLDQRSLLTPLVQAQPPAAPAVLEEAARALGQLGAMDAQPVLAQLAERAPSANIQVAAAGALAQLQNARGPETLKRLLSDGDDVTRVHASLLLLERGDLSGAPLLWASIGRSSLAESARIQLLGRLALSGDVQARQRLAESLSAKVAGEASVHAAYALARLGEDSGWAHLKQVARQQVPEQLLALRLLASLGEPEGYAQILRLAATRNQPDSIRELALAGVADSARDDSLSVLAKVLDEGGASARLRIAAAGAILQITAGERARLGEQSLSWARAALGSDSVSARELAIAVLGDLGSEQSIEPLGRALNDAEKEIRKSAALALGRKIAPAALQVLRASLDDTDADVRTAGMQSMGLIIKALEQRGDREAANVVITAVRSLTGSTNERDRVVASGLLMTLGKAMPEQRDQLTRGLSSTDVQVRRLAVELVQNDRPALVKALADPDSSVRLAAAIRLAAEGARDGVAVLRQAVDGGNREGLLAHAALRKLGIVTAPPPGLGSLLQTGDLATRLEVLAALSEFPPDDALRLIQLTLLDPIAVIRRRVAEVAAALYRQTRQERFLQMVRSLRNDPDVIVRVQAATLLQELATLPSQPAAAPVLPSAPQEPLRPSASSAPGTPGSRPADAPASLPPSTLGAVLFDGEDGVRIQIDKGASQILTGRPLPLSAGKHRVSYVGGAQEFLVVAGKSQKISIPLSLADQYLHDGKDALNRKDLQSAQENLDRVRRLAQRGKTTASLQADLAYQQARIHEARERLDAAIGEYNRALTVPASQRRPELNAALQSTLARLAAKAGRIQIFTPVDGKCQMTRELLSVPGEQVISLGKGQTRTVYAPLGSTTKVMACP